MLRMFIIVLTLGSLLATGLAHPAVAAAPVDWKTGNAFRDELEEPLLASWSGIPVRTLLANLAKQRRIAIWLDRRVDPGKLVDFSPRDIPLRQALEKLSETIFCGVSIVGPVVYIGPVRSCENLATLAAVKRAEIQRLPKARASKLLAAAAWHWPERSEPRDLVQQLVDEAGLAARNLPEAVPHDLWPALDLPPTAWADRLTLVLAGFGLTYDVASDGQSVTFLPWPEKISYEFAYAVRGDAARILEQLRPRYPKADLRASSGRIVVLGRYEDHDEIARVLRGESVGRTVKTGTGRKTFTLNVERQPVGPAAKAIAEKLGLQVEFAPELEAKLNEPVTFKVVDASLEELWNALAKAAGFTAQVNGNNIVLRPGKDRD